MRVLLAGMGLVAVGAHVVFPWLLARALDQLLGGGPMSGVTVALVAVGLSSIVLDALLELILGHSRAADTGSWRRRLIRHILAIGPGATERFAGGDLISRFTAGAAQAGNAGRGLIAAITAIVPAAAGLVALFLIDPWVGVAFVAGLPALALLLRAFMRDVKDLSAAYQRTQGEISGRLVEALAGRQTIAAAATVERETQRVLSPLEQLRRHGLQTWRAEAKVSWRAEALVSTLVYAVVAVAGVRLAAGRVSPGELVAAWQYASMATGLMGLAYSFGIFARVRAGADRLAEVLALPRTSHGTRGLPAGPGTLEFRAVSTPLWQAASFVVPGGSRVAVVGGSGSGKSLLAALAGRLADPDVGTVALDGVPLRELDHAVLRREVAYAFDRPALLGETIADAIAFGSQTASAEAMRRAARDADADGFITRLPAGYEAAPARTPLSGGETQRLGLARAFAHAGRLLILDDALSSLDTATQHRIGSALRRVQRGSTVLITTHRLRTAAESDLVIWMDDGVLRGPAPHGQLWQNPRYRSVFQPAGA